MAIRLLRYDNDPILHKKAREVDKVDDNIKTLVKDMQETMKAHNGVGLAAPQIRHIKESDNSRLNRN